MKPQYAESLLETLLEPRSDQGNNRAMLQLPPLSLYVHIPWCVRKCPYCDFNSHEVGASPELPEEEYLAALQADLLDSIRYAQGRKIKTIFFGGGTPSIASVDTIAACIDMAEEFVGIEQGAEITMEANPGTFEQEKFIGFRQAGVNRLSIGIQSLDETRLRALGRIHSSTEALTAVDMARAAGFDNINLDLMYGLPGQTLEDAIQELQQLMALEPEHISWYELTIEPNTEFYSKPPDRPDDDKIAEISDAGIALLASNGFERYEISAYAKNGKQCAHNLNYWEFGDYLGVGAGAHEKITLIDSGTVQRRSKTRLPKHYIDRIGSRAATDTLIDSSDLPFEFCINALRLISGVSAKLFTDRTGLSLDLLKKKLQGQIDKGLVEPVDQKIQATSRGNRYLNAVLEVFLD